MTNATDKATGTRVGVRISGTGMFAPEKVLTNDDLAQLVDTNDEWITQRTGIRERRIVENGTTARHLGINATKQAIANAGIEPSDLDFLINATLTPEMVCPATATRIVNELGASPAGGVDISAACSGFVYGMNMASGLIQSGAYRHIAVIGAEALSTICNWEDRGTCVLFGDGAGAAIFSADDNPERGCLYQSMSSDGGRWAELYCPTAEHDLPENGDGAEFTGAYRKLHMNGREIYKFAVTTLLKEIRKATKAIGVEPGDLAMVVPHQSNMRIMESARDKLQIPTDKMYINIDRFGNTSAASVPICLHELVEAKRVKEGDLILFVALGGGLTWATSVWKL